MDTSVPARIIEVDGFDTPASTVLALKRQGRTVICYMSGGSWESYRPDRDRFPRSTLGKRYAGYPDERWLDVRRIDLLAPVLRGRMDLCASKGFDAVDFDNVNGYENDTGFPLTASDQLRFNRWIAREVHARGMAAVLKNDGAQVPRLVRSYDAVVVEECFEQRNCADYAPFARAGKAVLAIEYRLGPARFCEEARRRGYSAIRKRLDLRAYRRTC